MKKTTRLKTLIADQKILIMPGAYDCLSAKLIEQAGFQAIQCSGYGFAACLLGQPDCGLMTFTEVLNHTRNLVRCVDIPVMADGDTGYGNVVNVVRTVQEFEEAGCAGVNLEDQAWPKRCGHMAGKEIVSTQEMISKIRAAAWARRDKDFVINARTDARQKYGPEEVVLRAKAYWGAGADLIFLEAPQSVEELRYYASQLVPAGVRISANMLNGGRTPLVSFRELEDLGYSRCSIPVTPVYAAAMGLKKALEKIVQDGHNRDLDDYIIPFSDFNKLVGLPEIRSLEEMFLTDENIESKYGTREELAMEKESGR